MNIPILIPIKTKSVRCPGKNIELLPYTLEYCKKLGYINNVVIISDSDIYEPITNRYKIYDYFIETRVPNQDNLTSCYNYCKINNIYSYIELPVTQPVRSDDLIDNIIETNLDIYDMATSYVISADRSIFQIKDDLSGFVIPDIERKGCLCGELKTADGAIYYTTKRFMKKVLESENPNYTFWNNNTRFILNKAPFVDIDTKHDMELFNKYYKKYSF